MANHVAGPADGGFKLQSRTVGALPIVNALLGRLGVDDRLEQEAPADPRAKVAPAAALGALLRNLVEAREPLYALREWAESRDPALLGLPEDAFGALNDDRVGRALDRLFDADRAALQTAIVVSAIKTFSIATAELHNDSTSITLHGRYAGADGKTVRGQPTAAIRRGHNKDYRPDLKQLLWVLTVTADGAVPLHCRILDGNTADTEPHAAIWDTLVSLAGRPGFLYVADSKLCTRENMDHIDSSGGRFLTVLPRSRSEDPDFREWIQAHNPDWTLVRQKGSPSDQSLDAYLMCEAPWPSAEGYRVAWVLQTSKRRRDAESRRARIKKASGRLDELATKLAGPKARIRTKAGADAAAQVILKETRTERFIDIRLEETTEERYRQEKRGRPGENTRYRRDGRTRITLTWSVRDEGVAAAAASDGMFPLITNDRELSLGELLDHYKYQPCLERRHEQLKSGLEVVPMWLKKVDRIEAILLLYFVALLVRALIEREIRGRMKAEDLKTVPIYPEDRDCPAPSAEAPSAERAERRADPRHLRSAAAPRTHRQRSDRPDVRARAHADATPRAQAARPLAVDLSKRARVRHDIDVLTCGK